MNYLIATIKAWNIANFKKLEKADKKNRWFLIDWPKNLTLAKINKIRPRYIFFPHWSWIIPEAIWSNYTCVVFHMTDLPYGRGGTPLQNLIIKGHQTTKISALKVDGGLDTGDIYFKENLSLSGSAQEIYERASQIIFQKMIPKMVKGNLQPKKQTGRVVSFARRKPEQSQLPLNASAEKLYDFIRMLDADGYPRAYLKIGYQRLEFSNAKLTNNQLTANVKIIYEYI